jgi:hypothetical protein
MWLAVGRYLQIFQRFIAVDLSSYNKRQTLHLDFEVDHLLRFALCWDRIDSD